MVAVSVPIRGLFNLTPTIQGASQGQIVHAFPSPSGDYLI